MSNHSLGRETNSFAEYLSLLRRCTFNDFKVGKDMAIGALIAIATVGLQKFWGLISLSDWRDHKWQWILSVALPFLGYLFIHIIVRAFRSPYEVHKQREQFYENELRALRTFKQEAEDKEVKLEISALKPLTVLHHFPDKTTENAYALRVLFSNKRKLGFPGKIARDVIANITYIDANGKTISLQGRWAASTQPEARSPLESTLDLLRADFYVGSELQLDLAAKFVKDAECFAIDNNSFPMIRHERTSLTGPRIKAVIQLQSTNVHQFFEVEFMNSEWEIACQSVREI